MKLEKSISLTIGICFLFSLFVFLGGCAKTFQGEYADPETVEIVDDRWNETDARKTAETLIKGMLDKSWLAVYSKEHSGKKPYLIVDEVENRTDEHIDTKALTEFMRDELINSGRISFLNAEKRQKILDELQYQQSGAVDKSKAMQVGKQLGAEYFLGGAVTSNVHTQGGLKTVTYQTNMTLTNLETAEIEWSEKYLVKKRFKRSGSKW